MAEPIEAAEDDIGADIRAAMAESAPANEVKVAPEAEIKPEPEAQKPSEETAQQDRERDEAGRFAKTQEKAQVVPATPAEPEPERTIRPPVSWSATAKALFDKLDPAVQQEVLKREKDIEDGKAQWDQKGERLNKFDALIAPHRDRLQLAQQDEFGYVQALIKADEMLRTNPVQALVQIAAMYGVNLNGQTPPQQAQQPQPQQAVTPQAIQQLVQAELARQNEERDRAQYVSEWESFRTSADHPYAENVKLAMAALLREGTATDLNDAYDQACWANKEVRTLLQAQQTAPQVARRAEPAGLSVTGARGNGHMAHVTPGVNGSIEDDIRAAFAEVSGRA